MYSNIYIYIYIPCAVYLYNQHGHVAGLSPPNHETLLSSRVCVAKHLGRPREQLPEGTAGENPRGLELNM